MTRTRTPVVLTTLLALACAGCTGGDKASTEPTPSAPSASPASSSGGSTTVPAYLANFSARERRAYGEAVGDYRRFGAGQAAIMALGKATPTAWRFYHRYTADWQTYWATLRQRERQGIRIKGHGTVIRFRPGKVAVDRDGTGNITLKVCGIPTGVRVLQSGTPIPQPRPTPRIVGVEMVRLQGESRWRVLYERVGPKC